MHYTIDNITALIGARRFGSAEARIDWLLTDSRSLAFPETTLFFALRTKLGDGHHYIAELYRRGVRNFVVGNVPTNYATDYADANFLLVKVTQPDALYAHLVSQGIIVRNRHRVKGCEGCLRVTIGTPDENQRLLQSFKLFA